LSTSASGDVGSSYIGLYGGGGTFTFTIRAIYATSASFDGSDGYFQGNTPTGDVAASVTYIYTPTAIPETNTFALMSGFMALAAVVYKRRKQSLDFVGLPAERSNAS